MLYWLYGHAAFRSRPRDLCRGFLTTRLPDPGVSRSRPAALRQPPGELAVLLTLAAVQFTHIVDFMIMMPLGPQLMRILEIGPRPFSLLVSAYTFAAAASGFVAAFWIDRFDHKRVLLVLYGGFIVATALCGLAPNYPLLLAARIVAGTFGGVIGGLVLADCRGSRPLCAPGNGHRHRGHVVFARRGRRTCPRGYGSLRIRHGERRFSCLPPRASLSLS